MKKIILHGALAEEFGGPYNFKVESPGEAIRALCSQFDGFETKLREGLYRIRKGTIEDGMDQIIPTLHLGMGDVEELHIIPELEGGKKGVGKVLLGIALIGASFLIPGMQFAGMSMMKGLSQTAFHVFGSSVTFGHVAMFGASMALGGVAMMMTPTPEVGNYGDREQSSSFMFNGPENRAEQGAVIPIVYGVDVWVGSLVIHTSVTVQDIAIGSGFNDGRNTGGQSGVGGSLKNTDMQIL